MNRKLCSVILIMALICMPAFFPAVGAAEDDGANEASISISFSEGDEKLAGAQFDLYRVAGMDEEGMLTVVAPFDEYPVRIVGEDDEAWKTLASTLEGYVRQDGLEAAASGVTDENGLMTFSGLERGLYLIMGAAHEQNGYIYRVSPFMVSVPQWDAEQSEWKYEIAVSPKADFEPVEDTEPEKLKVLKIWEDEGGEDLRPAEITVHLLMDGEAFETVKLNAAGNWRYTWEELEGGHQWTVVEEPVEQYQVQISLEGITYVIRNSLILPEFTPTPEPTLSPEPTPELTPEPGPEATPTVKPTKTPAPTEEPRLPQTGQVWWPVPVLVALGLLLIVLGLAHRKGEGYEK